MKIKILFQEIGLMAVSLFVLLLTQNGQAQDVYNFYFQKAAGPQTLIQGSSGQAPVEKVTVDQNGKGIKVEQPAAPAASSTTSEAKNALVPVPAGANDGVTKGVQVSLISAGQVSGGDSFGYSIGAGSLGIGLGYINSKVEDFGYSAEVDYYTLQSIQDGITYGSFLGELNGTYGINKYLRVSGGLNLVYLTSSGGGIGVVTDNPLRGELGWQLGLSAQFNKRFGGEVEYVNIQAGTAGSYPIRMSGELLKLTATF